MRRALSGREAQFAKEVEVEVTYVIPGTIPQPREKPGADEDPGDTVVIGGGDRVELMIVAARAAYGEAKESAAGDADLLVDGVHAEHVGVDFELIVRTDRQEAGGDILLSALRIVCGRQ